MSSELSQGMPQIEHIALATNHLECLCDFYRQLGGVALPLSPDPGGGLRALCDFFRGGFLDLFVGCLGVFELPRVRHAAARDNRLPRLLHLGFTLGSADAVDELSRVLAAAGHRVLEPPHRADELGRYESVVLDSDGNRLKLSV